MVVPQSQEEVRLQFAELDEHHLGHFQSFSCGNAPWQTDLEDFLKNDALAQQRSLINKTYVFYTMQNNPVGFATLAAAAVTRPERHSFPYPQISALLIGRLAVDSSHQRKTYGTTMMAWIRAQARKMIAGCRFIAVHVDEANTGAIAFYEKEGFIRAPVKTNEQLLLYLYDLLARPEITADAAKAAQADADRAE